MIRHFFFNGFLLDRGSRILLRWSSLSELGSLSVQQDSLLQVLLLPLLLLYLFLELLVVLAP